MGRDGRQRSYDGYTYGPQAEHTTEEELIPCLRHRRRLFQAILMEAMKICLLPGGMKRIRLALSRIRTMDKICSTKTPQA